jgi:hypothetical protein
MLCVPLLAGLVLVLRGDLIALLRALPDSNDDFQETY